MEQNGSAGSLDDAEKALSLIQELLLMLLMWLPYDIYTTMVLAATAILKIQQRLLFQLVQYFHLQESC